MAPADRERDAAGRPRNARPRGPDGRPLPRDAAGVERVPDDLVLAPADALAEAERLLVACLPFAAHDVLEAVWKAAPPAEAALWRGLAQLAVGLTHAQRGNARGAAALLRRGAENLAPYARQSPYGVPVEALAAWARAGAAAIEGGGVEGEGDLGSPRPALVPGS